MSYKYGGKVEMQKKTGYCTICILLQGSEVAYHIPSTITWNFLLELVDKPEQLY